MTATEVIRIIILCAIAIWVCRYVLPIVLALCVVIYALFVDGIKTIKRSSTHKEKPKSIHIPVVENNTKRGTNTTKLAQLLNNESNKPHIPVRKIDKFDWSMYNEIMADAGVEIEKPTAIEKPILSDYQPDNKYIENDDYLADLIDKIVADNEIKTPDKKAFHGVLTRRIIMAKQKPTLDNPITESISVKALFICETCGYKADNKWGYYGHRKKHANKKETF